MPTDVEREPVSEVRIGVIGAAGRGAMARHWHDPPGGRSVGVGAADPSEAALEWYREHVNGKAPLATPLAGRMSVAVGCAATKSLRNGWRRMDVPPLPEDIRRKVF